MCDKCGSENVVEKYCDKCNGNGYKNLDWKAGSPVWDDCDECAGWGTPCTGESECLDCGNTWGKVEV